MTYTLVGIAGAAMCTLVIWLHGRPRLICDCRHHYRKHNLTTGVCRGYQDTISPMYVRDCNCSGYAGPLPKEAT